ncbi:hypothetical protein V2S66_18395 [Streptomyces sp. V4-01]|uniref:Uncharacterized protein n=1 Tax=Actinacidiphila polyblastidii TaxID=3110430 RepID=A0ABU7PDQ8_9ACTN|nr:hypothetical protein [Streptomyces sp. V4-01]
MNAVRARRLLECCYVGLIAALAGLGAASGTPAPYVAAILLTLPFGISATVCIYGGYAALKGIGGLWAARTLADGGDPGWLTVSSATLNILALTAAAVANAILAERTLRRREATRAATRAAGPLGA